VLVAISELSCAQNTHHAMRKSQGNYVLLNSWVRTAYRSTCHRFWQLHSSIL